EVSNPIYDPLNRTQRFDGNIIPRYRFHPTSVKLMEEFYPAPNLNPGLVPFNYESTLNRFADKDQFIQRIDFVESSSSSWFGRYSWGSESEVNPIFYKNASRIWTTVHQAMFSNTRILSPSKVNEFRAGYNQFYNVKAGEFAYTRDVMSELKIPGLPALPPVGWGTPEIQITGFVSPGSASTFCDIDDTWKIHPKVSINLGLRYEYTPPFLDKTGNLVNFHVPFVDMTPNVADMSRHPTLVRQGRGDFYDGLPVRFEPSVKVARDGRLGDRLVADDKNDFAPRLGIAWNPNSKWVVRTGAGVFYAQDTGNPRFDMARNAAGRRRDEATATQLDLNWNTPYRGLGEATALIVNPYGLANIYDRRTPYSIQYLLNVQRELGGDTALEVGYIGSVSRKLETLRSFNDAIPSA